MLQINIQAVRITTRRVLEWFTLPGGGKSAHLRAAESIASKNVFNRNIAYRILIRAITSNVLCEDDGKVMSRRLSRKYLCYCFRKNSLCFMEQMPV